MLVYKKIVWYFYKNNRKTGKKEKRRIVTGKQEKQEKCENRRFLLKQEDWQVCSCKKGEE